MSARRTTLALAVGGGVAFGVAVSSTVFAQSSDAPRLVVVRPQEGDVTSVSPDVAVTSEAVSEGTVILFGLTVDGVAVGQDGAVGSPSGAGSFQLVGGAVDHIGVTGLSVGAHTLRVAATSPSGVAPASVRFSVGTGGSRVNVVAIVIGVSLLGLWLVYVRKVLRPRAGPPGAAEEEEPGGR